MHSSHAGHHITLCISFNKRRRLANEELLNRMGMLSFPGCELGLPPPTNQMLPTTLRPTPKGKA